MKRTRKLWLTIAGLALGLFIGASSTWADNLGNPGVLPPNSNAFGKSYAEWSAAWWQWLLSIPAANNPNLDTTGAHCAEGQSGKVWFLSGTFGGDAVTRNCTIPNGKALFFSPLNGVFGQGVGDCTGPSDCDITVLRQLAAANVDNPQLLEVTIDGVPVKNLDQYRVASPVFNAFFPQHAIFDLEPGTHSPLVSDGYWLLLAPLSRGTHTIHIHGIASGDRFEVDVTYILTVTK